MLYIMRHGWTDWNDRHKLQGHTDIPPDLCFCSLLIRLI